MLGKKALDVYKVKAIYAACMQHFPLQCLETQLMVDKEMRTAIDEVCRKTKVPAEAETVSDHVAHNANCFYSCASSCTAVYGSTSTFNVNGVDLHSKRMYETYFKTLTS